MIRCPILTRTHAWIFVIMDKLLHYFSNIRHCNRVPANTSSAKLLLSSLSISLVSICMDLENFCNQTLRK